MYRFQSQIRKLPVANLSQTLKDVRRFADPVCSSAEVRESFLQACQEFEGGVGKLLQAKLEAFAAEAPTGNWLEPMWDGMYLTWREPLPVHMNYFLQADLDLVPATAPALDHTSMAFHTVAASVDFARKVFQEAVEPDRDRMGPTCMSQYARVFGHARIPHKEEDIALCFSDPPKGLVGEDGSGKHFKTTYVPVGGKHLLTVVRHGQVFTMPLTSGPDLALDPHLERNLRSICEGGSTSSRVSLVSATAAHRDVWAECRENLLAAGGDQADLLRQIDQSLFVLCIDDHECESEDELLKGYVMGHTKNDRWFDKHCVILGSVKGKPKVGVLFEHMPGDGLTTIKWVDAIQSHLESGPQPLHPPSKPASPTTSMLTSMGLSLSLAEAAIADGESFLEQMDSAMSAMALRSPVGAERLKQAGFAPDAAFQLAMMVALRRAREGAGVTPLCATYESCSTARFLHGRTEVIRSASPEADLASKLIVQGSDRAYEAAQAAVAAHKDFTARCQDGQGVDRHLTGLRHMLVAHKHELSEEHARAAQAFLGHPLLVEQSTWRLSTSHCGGPKTAFFGFGPVVEGGTGVGYHIRPHEIRATVTAFAGESTLEAAEFGALIDEALHDLVALRR
jgi:carnitine O-acetyltransferase